MAKIADNVTKLIGDTPLIRLNNISQKYQCQALAKCEFLNPSGSVKDRIANAMIQTALSNGNINQKTTIIEPTSGNTGIGLACVCASLGLKLILTMPSSMSIERQKLFVAYGAKVELTSPTFGMQGAIDKAIQLQQSIPNSFIPQQFENMANPKIHEQTTAKEILKDTNGNIDIFVTGVGTGGTISGVGKILKQYNKKIQIVAIEPKNSAVISGNLANSHKIQGIGAGFIPKVLDINIIDDIIKISDKDATDTAKHIAKDEGLLVGISSGANIYALEQLAKLPQNKGKTIVTILCDSGARYLSDGLYS